VALTPGTASFGASNEEIGLTAGESIVVTLPAAGYENVARLITGGLASRLDFGFEAVDDLQLAVELVLRSLPARRGAATVAFSEDGACLWIEITPAAGVSLDRRLDRDGNGEGVELGASLRRLVDAVALSDGSEPAVVLTKALPART
jgi:hypothetical protein